MVKPFTLKPFTKIRLNRIESTLLNASRQYGLGTKANMVPFGFGFPIFIRWSVEASTVKITMSFMLAFWMCTLELAGMSRRRKGQRDISSSSMAKRSNISDWSKVLFVDCFSFASQWLSSIDKRSRFLRRRTFADLWLFARHAIRRWRYHFYFCICAENVLPFYIKAAV